MVCRNMRLCVTCMVVGLVGIMLLCGCQAVEKPAVVETSPVFFPPFKPRIQYLTSFDRPEDLGVEGPGFWETFIVGEPEEDELIIRSYGAAIHGGKIYVCDLGRRRIVVLDIPQKTFADFPIDSRVKLPFNIFIQDDGTKYIADPAGGAVFVYNAQDRLIQVLGMEYDIKPRDVFVRGNEIYITDRKNIQVMVLDKTTGKLLRTVGERTETTMSDELGEGEFGIISDLAVDQQGNIYVTDMLRSQVLKFGPSGEFLRSYSGPGSSAANLIRPKGIAVDRENRIWVADSGPAEAVKIYNQEGRLLMIFGTHGSEPGKMFMPAKVTLDYNAENIALFQPYAVAGAQLEHLVLVTNQFGPNKINVYGFGTFPDSAVKASLVAPSAESTDSEGGQPATGSTTLDESKVK